MIIDSLSSMPPPQAVDIKEKKRVETEDQRPIEESERSNSAELDLSKEDVSMKLAAEETRHEDNNGIEIYSAKGDLLRETPPAHDTNGETNAVDIIV